MSQQDRFMPGSDRYVNAITHDCGCKTAFDIILWSSHAFHRCDFHRAKIEADHSYEATLPTMDEVRSENNV